MFNKKKKSPLKATKLAERKKRLLYFRIGATVISLVVFLVLVSWLSRAPFIVISSIEVTGNSAVDVESVKAIAQKNLAGSYAMLFAKSNRLLYPKDTIKTELTETHKRIESLAMNVDGKTLKIALKERAPSYVWCKDEVRDVPECFFIDATGYIFSEAPTFSGSAFFAFYGPITGDTVVGSHYLDQDTFKTLDAFVANLESRGVESASLKVEKDSNAQLALKSGGVLIFKKDQNLEELTDSLVLIKERTKILSPDLEYIDMRFGNKVYYKAVGDNAVELPE